MYTKTDNCHYGSCHIQIRKEERIQELRSWQREWREENANIKDKVENFWKEHEPEHQEELRRSAKLRRSAGHPACFKLRTWSPSPERPATT